MEKVILLGKDSRDERVKVEIKYSDDGRLSLVGEVGYKRFGQVHPVEISRFSDGWTLEMVNELNRIWARWHLNDMRAGCEHQRMLSFTIDAIPELGEECVDCGYKYGCEWKFEPVPQKIIDWLFSLPSGYK